MTLLLVVFSRKVQRLSILFFCTVMCGTRLLCRNYCFGAPLCVVPISTILALRVTGGQTFLLNLEGAPPPQADVLLSHTRRSDPLTTWQCPKAFQCCFYCSCCWTGVVLVWYWCGTDADTVLLRSQHIVGDFGAVGACTVKPDLPCTYSLTCGHPHQSIQPEPVINAPSSQERLIIVQAPAARQI